MKLRFQSRFAIAFGLLTFSERALLGIRFGDQGPAADEERQKEGRTDHTP